jgi:hypothetical protein
MPADRADDSYAIFSLLIPALQDTKKEYLISDTTADPTWDAYPQTPAVQTKPPAPVVQTFFANLDPMDVPDDRLAPFQEAVADYISRKGERVWLEPKLSLRLPYRLMNAEELIEYSKLSIPHVSDPSHPWPPDRKLVKKYKGRGPLSRMSEVYFDREHTLGLVRAVAGNSCKENWYSFEKRSGQWRAASWKDVGQCEEA